MLNSADGLPRFEQARALIFEVGCGSSSVEQHTGRKVEGFLSSSQQDPDLLDFVFVLESSPLTQPENAEPPDSSAST